MEAVANHLVEADARIHILENKAESDKIISNSPIDILIGNTTSDRFISINYNQNSYRILKICLLTKIIEI